MSNLFAYLSVCFQTTYGQSTEAFVSGSLQSF